MYQNVRISTAMRMTAHIAVLVVRDAFLFISDVGVESAIVCGTARSLSSVCVLLLRGHVFFLS